MSEKIRLRYNRKLSIKENAEICGVSESSIRQYLKSNGIDRHYDAMYSRYKEIKDLQKKGLSAKAISVRVGCCLNTAKKYMRMNDFSISPKTDKSSLWRKTSNDNIIKSVSYSQHEILRNILKLHVKQGYFDADFTYSIGEFYSKGIVPQPQRKYDQYPQKDDVQPLQDAESIKDASIKAVIVDLPFLITRKEWTDNCRMNLRFNSFDNPKDAFEANSYMLDLAFRKLRNRGILVMKTMDVLHVSGQIWISQYVIREAERLGFNLIDMFILIAKSKMLNSGLQQKVARKFHSYFLVFKKKN